MSSSADSPFHPVVLIPAWNEARTVGDVVTEARQELDGPVVVIDDCSSDQTGKQARAAGATVLTHCWRLGQWGAMQTGIRYARLRGYGPVLTMDADGQHLAAMLPRLIEPLAREDTDLVIGACPTRAGASRKIAWAFFRRLTGLSVTDLTSGFRGFSRRVMPLLLSREATGLDYPDIGVLLLMRHHGMRIKEVPVQMRQRLVGKSKLFGSWPSILAFLVQTGLISLARMDRGREWGWRNDAEPDPPSKRGE